jgi:poly(3-hydroxybutyrate) depolymerase
MAMGAIDAGTLPDGVASSLRKKTMDSFILHALRNVTIFVGLLLGGAQASRAESLPALGADISKTSVSGLSSGAFMAVQFQVAYSKTVSGAGVIAGGPFGCAYTPGTEHNPNYALVLIENAARALTQCMQDNGVPAASELVDRAASLAKADKIDPLEGLAADRVYLFWGGRDTTVTRPVMNAANEFFIKAGVPAANIIFEENKKAAHAFVTEDSGLPCGAPGAPYVNDCDYDQARAVLTQIRGPLKPAGKVVDANYVTFNQESFTKGFYEPGFSHEGVAYIPSDCREHPGCSVHVVFHGCEQGRKLVGDDVVKGAGYAKWAEGNRLIVLFPQVEPGPLNPKGCWDWWGYTGPRFLEREAPQMLAVRRMLERLGSPAS